MKKLSISVTEAARNFSECINQARYRKVTFLLVKNGSPVAQLGPVVERVCSGPELAAALATVGLTDGELQAWRRDLKSSRKNLEVPEDKWK